MYNDTKLYLGRISAGLGAVVLYSLAVLAYRALQEGVLARAFQQMLESVNATLP